MTIQQLRDFLAVAQHGSFRSAARACRTSQSGLTKSVSRLEARYGLSLLDRTAQGVELNAVGFQFAACAQDILQQVERTESLLEGFHRERRHLWHVLASGKSSGSH